MQFQFSQPSTEGKYRFSTIIYDGKETNWRFALNIENGKYCVLQRARWNSMLKTPKGGWKVNPVVEDKYILMMSAYASTDKSVTLNHFTKMIEQRPQALWAVYS